MGLLDSITGTDPGTPAAAAAPAPPAPVDNGQSAFNFFVNKGLAPQQAAGIVGNLQGESGQGLNPAAVNRGDGTDGSDSIGIGQWNGARAQALKDYAASKNTPWTDLNTQLEFLHGELQGPENAAYQRLTAARTPEEAGQAMLAYERPKDWNKPGAHPERAQYAIRAMQAYGAGAPPAPAMTPAAVPASGRAPMFAQAPASSVTLPFTGSGPGAGVMPQPQAVPAMAAPPIFASPRRPIDLAKLMAAFPAQNFYAKG